MRPGCVGEGLGGLVGPAPPLVVVVEVVVVLVTVEEGASTQ